MTACDLPTGRTATDYIARDETNGHAYLVTIWPDGSAALAIKTPRGGRWSPPISLERQ